MRIAVMADIHGNIAALDAVLQDVERCGVDAYWILGDIVALGPAPVEVLERLSSLPDTRCIRGNTDRYTCTGDRPPPSFEQVRADSSLLPTLVEVAGTFAWTQGAVTRGGWLDWLSALPVELRAALPDGTRVLGVHAAPGRDDGPGFQPGLSQPDLVHLLAGCDAGLVFTGHTHQAVDVVIKGTRVINVGCVSNPLPPDPRACYTILEADAAGYRVDARRVDYDRQAVVARLKQINHPGAEFIIQHLRGQRQPLTPLASPRKTH